MLVTARLTLVILHTELQSQLLPLVGGIVNMFQFLKLSNTKHSQSQKRKQIQNGLYTVNFKFQ